MGRRITPPAHRRHPRPSPGGAAFRSNFIVGYGETEDDHDQLLRFVEVAQLDWCGFFAYSPEEGTYAAELDGRVPMALVTERLGELTELQDAITAARRDVLIGSSVEVLVDRPGIGRSHREAPEIDGVVLVDSSIPAGTFADVTIVDALGSDLIADRSKHVDDQRDAGRAVKPDVGTALATWANAITAARLLLSPLMFWLIPDVTPGRGWRSPSGSCCR